jgi:hypothetical protein
LGEKGAFMKIFSFTFGGLKNTNHKKVRSKSSFRIAQKKQKV